MLREHRPDKEWSLLWHNTHGGPLLDWTTAIFWLLQRARSEYFRHSYVWPSLSIRWSKNWRIAKSFKMLRGIQHLSYSWQHPWKMLDHTPKKHESWGQRIQPMPPRFGSESLLWQLLARSSKGNDLNRSKGIHHRAIYLLYLRWLWLQRRGKWILVIFCYSFSSFHLLISFSISLSYSFISIMTFFFC